GRRWPAETPALAGGAGAGRPGWHDRSRSRPAQGQWSVASGPVRAYRVNRTVRPARGGEQQYSPPQTAASGARWATRTRRNGSSSTRARTVTASPARLARTVTSRPAHPGTGATDQSEYPWVTTAPTCGAPSETSTPALTHSVSDTRRKRPAWSNCSV